MVKLLYNYLIIALLIFSLLNVIEMKKTIADLRSELGVYQIKEIYDEVIEDDFSSECELIKHKRPFISDNILVPKLPPGIGVVK